MPELPEVEVLRASLEGRLVGRRIERLRVSNPDLREPVDRRRLSRRAGRRRIEALGRRAKYLLIEVEGGSTLIVHLGMSGRLTLAPAETPRELHEHVTFFLDSGERLCFRDSRRFGLVFALPTAAVETDRHFAHLGVEPLAREFTAAALKQAATGRRGPVKGLLMDGRVVVGVGNIYAAEALFRAGIHPARSVRRIGAGRWQLLVAAVKATLEDAIRQGGTTLKDFADGTGRSGLFQVSLAVYGREGEMCPACGAPIRRIVQAGRSTFYCPRCQR